MKKIKIIPLILLAVALSACRQSFNQHKHPILKTNAPINTAVKEAFDAWQAGNSKTWLSHFTADVSCLMIIQGIF
jgi:hypothetical protein